MSTDHEAYGTVAAYPAGQRLECDACGSQILVVKASPAHPVEQVLQCCGRDMRPAFSEPAEDTWSADD